MSRSIRLAAFAATLGLVAFWAQDAEACSCMPVKPPAESAESADAVFEGVVGEPTPEGSRLLFPVEVSRVFKGDIGAQVTIRTADNSAACGRSYEVGQSYLIYAHQVDDAWGDGLCSRTRLSAEADEDFAALGPGSSPGGDDGPVAEEPTDPPAESPRIDEPATPPPASPGKRGCTIAAHESPASAGWASGLALLALLGLRRRS
jgi:hypothetical protein